MPDRPVNVIGKLPVDAHSFHLRFRQQPGAVQLNQQIGVMEPYAFLVVVQINSKPFLYPADPVGYSVFMDMELFCSFWDAAIKEKVIIQCFKILG